MINGSVAEQYCAGTANCWDHGFISNNRIFWKHVLLSRRGTSHRSSLGVLKTLFSHLCVHEDSSLKRLAFAREYPNRFLKPIVKGISLSCKQPGGCVWRFNYWWLKNWLKTRLYSNNYLNRKWSNSAKWNLCSRSDCCPASSTTTPASSKKAGNFDFDPIFGSYCVWPSLSDSWCLTFTQERASSSCTLGTSLTHCLTTVVTLWLK